MSWVPSVIALIPSIMMAPPGDEIGLNDQVGVSSATFHSFRGRRP
jgi:hypothetical protein